MVDGAPLYLGMTVGSDAEMAPRQEVLSVPYALGMTTVLVVPPATREVFREGWELEGREAAHVDHVTDDLTGFLRRIFAAG